MSGVNMRFSGVSLSHNPKTLKITKNKKVSSDEFIGGKKRFSGAYENISKISGTAELYGENCFLEYEKLLRLSAANKSEILAVPELGAFRAVLSDISIAAEPKSDFLTVAFEFKLVNSGRTEGEILSERFYTAQSGENLFDIAFEFDAAVERLVQLNPQIRDIQNLNDGERVRIY